MPARPAICSPNPADLIKNGEITMMMITSGGDEADLRDGKDLRRLALSMQVRRRASAPLRHARAPPPSRRSPRVGTAASRRAAAPLLHHTPPPSGLAPAPAAARRPRVRPLSRPPTHSAPQIPIVTTIAGAKATSMALAAMAKGTLEQVPLQEYFPGEWIVD